MIRFLTFLLVMIVLPETAGAQNDLALCKLRAQYIASQQDAAYQPGIDVHGNPVVPADVNAVPTTVPDVVRIPVSIDLAQRLGNVPEGVELKTETGMVEVHRDGRVTFNGQDFSQQAAIVCGDTPVVGETLSSQSADQIVGQLPVEAAPAAAEAERPRLTDPQAKKSDQQKDIIWGEGF